MEINLIAGGGRLGQICLQNVRGEINQPLILEESRFDIRHIDLRYAEGTSGHLTRTVSFGHTPELGKKIKTGLNAGDTFGVGSTMRLLMIPQGYGIEAATFQAVEQDPAWAGLTVDIKALLHDFNAGTTTSHAVLDTAYAGLDKSLNKDHYEGDWTSELVVVQPKQWIEVYAEVTGMPAVVPIELTKTESRKQSEFTVGVSYIKISPMVNYAHGHQWIPK